MRGEVRKVGRLLDKWLDYICNICLILAGLMIVLMAVITTYGVIRRYIFHTPDERIFLFMCIFMLGCMVLTFAAIERLKRNISVDFISHHIPRVIREPLLNIGGPLLGLLFLTILIWRNWVEALFALGSDQLTTSIISIPTWPFRMSIAFGAGLLYLVLISGLVRYVVSLVENKEVKKAE
jgi:TRAP-type C4-dicarboxylate transport system permease small subunit